MEKPGDPETELVRQLSKMTPHSIARIALGDRLARPPRERDGGPRPRDGKAADEKDLK